MHRFVWDLTWGSSGGPGVDEESEYRNPRGPKVVPGVYTVRLTVDGKPRTQPLEIIMDPRSPATPEILGQQLQLGQQIFADTMEARRALAEIDSVRKQLADLQQKIGDDKDSAIKSRWRMLKRKFQRSCKPAAIPEQALGLQDGFRRNGLGPASCRRRGSRRAFAGDCRLQRIRQRVKAAIAEWSEFKTTKLSQLNQKLSEANLAPIAISEIEQEVQFLMSR